MTELHAGLALFRDQLRDAIAQDLKRSRRARSRRRWVLRLTPGVTAAAAAGALVIAFTGEPPVQSADAAILRHVAAALTSPPATILHERALVTAGSQTRPYELWILSDPPHRYHVIKWGHDAAGEAGAPYNPAASLRSLVQAGKATVTGSTTFDGVEAYKLTVSGAADRFLNGTAYVSRSDYRPLEIDTTGNGGERIVFQTYEYLPVTPASLQLLHTAAPPTAPSANKH